MDWDCPFVIRIQFEVQFLLTTLVLDLKQLAMEAVGKGDLEWLEDDSMIPPCVSVHVMCPIIVESSPYHLTEHTALCCLLLRCQDGVVMANWIVCYTRLARLFLEIEVFAFYTNRHVGG